MEELKKDNTIYYQQRSHHRQQLRQHILPSTIDMLEINHNPSTVSRKACQSLYQDQLEKEVAARTGLKERDRNGNGMGMGMGEGGAGGQGLSKAKSNSNYHGAGGNGFRDYDREKNQKVAQHIDLNYNGGSSFWRASQQHEHMRSRQLQQMGQTLQSQIRQKTHQSSTSSHTKTLQSQARQAQQQKLQLLSSIEKQQSQKWKQNTRQSYMRQIEEERLRRKGSQRFVYDNRVRHNPITNPIEYHIENPYILKQIQESRIGGKGTGMGAGEGEQIRY